MPKNQTIYLPQDFFVNCACGFLPTIYHDSKFYGNGGWGDVLGSEHETPASEHETPSSEHETPTSEHETPSSEHETPTSEHE
ncbi:MAG: hypothetical protein ACIWVG_13335, partial [Gloeotrichia echinulata HAB0833]